MTGTLDLLPNPDSPLARFDPRWKLAALTLAALMVVPLQTLTATTVAFISALALAAAARMPRNWYLGRLGGLALFLSLFVLLLPLLVHDDNGPTWHVFSLQVSWYGLRLALRLCLKALTVVTLALVMLVTAPLTATLKAANTLHVPGLLVQLGLLSYRYLFVLAAELARLRIALRVRGYRNRASLHSYRTVGHIAGMLLVRGYERAERVGQAMRCRGFDGQFRSLATFQPRTADRIFFLGITAGAIAILLWDLLER